MRCSKSLSGLITCQDLQAEHVDIRVIDCIDGCYAIIDVGSAHSLIPWCSAYSIQIRGKPATQPLNRVIS
jgi:hypothetical protein